MCHNENYNVSQNSLEDTHVLVMYVCEPLMFFGADIAYRCGYNMFNIFTFSE